MTDTQRWGRSGAAVVLVLATVTACGSTVAGDTAVPVGPTTGPVAEPTEPLALCAELPPAGALPGDLEGWWNGAPADADGTVLHDPADWPAEPRDHPRVATVDVDSGTVISLYDRTTCTSDSTGYVPPEPGPEWSAGSTVVLDADTGEVLSVGTPGG